MGKAALQEYPHSKTGTKDQNILGNKGDDVRIDWGYLYFVTKETEDITTSINKASLTRKQFIEKGNLPVADDKDFPRAANDNMVVLSILHNVGKVGILPANGHCTIAYDDIYSVEYFGQKLRPWWHRNEKTTVEQMLFEAEDDYKDVINDCDDMDKYIYKDAVDAGGDEYSQICILAYRQAIAAHKLVAGIDNIPYFFSKENFSNGSIGTVDVTYPSSPLFLAYNTTLLKAMLDPIFNYSESGKWTKPFAAHDLGTYPLANGQTYPEDMPVEECGNMLILTYAITQVDKNIKYAEKHWNVISNWATYLKDNGLDPANQLCTDDFAGHLAKNSHLSLKAILALKCYALMALQLELEDVAQQYSLLAKCYAAEWMQMANDSNHFTLTFDKKGTWSQKYNLVWNKLLKLNVFPEEVYKKEIRYYLSKQNKYGLPLDNRETYGKSDWMVWSAAMASDRESFNRLLHPVYVYINEHPDRIPISDWHQTITGKSVGFRARSVVGAYYIKVLEDKFKQAEQQK